MSDTQTIENLLKEHLSIIHLQVMDDSAQHAGHREAPQQGGSHYSLVVVSDDFQGKTRVERHRMIYEILKKELAGGVHALAIRALTKNESTSLSS